MISIAEAFRVWKRMFFAQKDYPFPPEARWLIRWLLVGCMVWTLAFSIGAVVVTEVAANGWAGFIDEISVAPARPSFNFTLDIVAFFSGLGLSAIVAAPTLYTLAVLRHWIDVGHDRWLNEGRMCRSCGSEGARAHTVNYHDQVMQFRQRRKDYDRTLRDEKRRRGGRVTESL